MESNANAALIKEIDQQIMKMTLAKKKEVAKEIKVIVKRMKALGISLADLSAAGARSISGDAAPGKKVRQTKLKKVGRKSSREPKGADGRSRVEAKYRDPVSGDTWTGRGRCPGWLDKYEKSGRQRSEFLIPAAA